MSQLIWFCLTPSLLTSQFLWFSRDTIPPAISESQAKVTTTFCLEHLLDASDIDREYSKCEDKVPDSVKKTKTPGISSYYDSIQLFRCIAVRVGLIEDDSKGTIRKTEMLRRIDGDNDYSDAKKRYVRSLVTSCHYWETCRNDYCDISKLKTVGRLIAYLVGK